MSEKRQKIEWLAMFSVAFVLLAILFYFFGGKRVDLSKQWIAYYCGIGVGTYADRAIMLSDPNEASDSIELEHVNYLQHIHSPTWLANDLIAFESDFDIRIVQLNSFILDSTHIDTVWMQYPTASPDRTRIAYIGGFSSLYVYNLADTTETKTVELYQPTHPTWSPDGQYIAVISRNAIVIADVLSHQVEELELESERISGISWSPNGGSIAFGGKINDTVGLYSLNLATGNSDLILETFGWEPVWSPDGQWIAFINQLETGGTGLFKVRADGSELQQIHTDERCNVVAAPAWSPLPTAEE